MHYGRSKRLASATSAFLLAQCFLCPGFVFAEQSTEDAYRQESSNQGRKEGEDMASERSSSEFAFTLYRQLASGAGNLVFSPFSIGSALEMLQLGARGETASKIEALLGQQRSVEQISLLTRGSDKSQQSPMAEWRVASALWLQEKLQVQSSYREKVAERFGAEIGEISSTEPEKSRASINAWVSRQTDDKITELFPFGSITASTPMALANAVYFKGAWENPFEKSSTAPARFYPEGSDPLEVPLMSQSLMTLYAEDEQAKLVELGYKGSQISFLAVLPKESPLSEFRKTFDAQRFAALHAQVEPRLGNVSLPRFSLRSSPPLQAALEALGAGVLFTPHADFSGMIEGDSPLFIGEAVHKAVIEVDEAGTEAAAATGMAMATGMPAAEAPFEFRADRPFLFFIVDRSSSTILFFGQYLAPAA